VAAKEIVLEALAIETEVCAEETGKKLASPALVAVTRQVPALVDERTSELIEQPVVEGPSATL
jgi:hypothetical protein